LITASFFIFEQRNQFNSYIKVAHMLDILQLKKVFNLLKYTKPNFTEHLFTPLFKKITKKNFYNKSLNKIIMIF
jgi:hypothetical protein